MVIGIRKPGIQEEFEVRLHSCFPDSSSFAKFFRSGFFLRPSPFQDKTVARFMFAARFESFGQLSPRTDWMVMAAAAFGLPLSATHGMIIRIHHLAPYQRPGP